MNFKLDHIVREFLIESYGVSQLNKQYPRFLQIAISGLREMYMDVGYRKNTVMIDIAENETVPLPSDYIDYARVGVCLHGQIIGLTENPNQCPPDLDDCGNVKKFDFANQDSNSDTPNYFYGLSSYDSYSKDGQRVGRQFGIGGGGSMIGSFKVFEDRGYMTVRGLRKSENFLDNKIVLEYYGSINRDEDGNMLVHPYDVEAMKAWMHWKYIQRLRSTPGGQAEEARRMYGMEKKKARKRHGAMNASEIVEAVRKGYKSSPKI